MDVDYAKKCLETARHHARSIEEKYIALMMKHPEIEAEMAKDVLMSQFWINMALMNLQPTDTSVS